MSQEVISEFMKILSSYNESNGKTRKYGTDVDIFKLEIHVISVIDKNPGIHVMGIADILKITKGCVSEVLRKLESKGLILKEQDPDNHSRLSLFLTESGKKAAKCHEEFHCMFNNEAENLLKNISSDGKEVVLSFLKNMDCILKNIDNKFQ